jgi:hypothetical protein
MVRAGKPTLKAALRGSWIRLASIQEIHTCFFLLVSKKEREGALGNCCIQIAIIAYFSFIWIFYIYKAKG